MRGLVKLFCMECNQEVMQGTRYCTRCGKELDPTINTISCPKCSARISFRGRFCPFCGTNVFSIKRSPIDPYGNYRIKAPVKYDDEKIAEEKRNKAIKYHVAGDYENAFNLFLSACSNDDDAIAEFYVGFYYMEGLYVKQDSATAIKYFTRSSDKGDNYSMYMLGEIYKHGIGVAVNKDIAKIWYTKACNFYMHNRMKMNAEDALKTINNTRIIKPRELPSKLDPNGLFDFLDNATYIELLNAKKKLEKKVPVLKEEARTSKDLPHFLKDIASAVDEAYFISESNLCLLYTYTGTRRFPCERFPEFELPKHLADRKSK